jgi:uncharacterized membrane protein YhaH (DUF805 family)
MHPGQNLRGYVPDPMDYRFLFLEPQGRLAPRPFARGFILLTGAMLVVTVLSAVVSPGLGILQYALVFPYLCLFGKRLHDAGLSAWLWLGFVAGFSFLSMVFSVMFLPVLSPAAFEMQADMQKVMATEGMGAALEALSLRASEYARLAAVTTIAAFLVASALTGYAAFRMRSDPQPNRHGPPTDNIGSTFR